MPLPRLICLRRNTFSSVMTALTFCTLGTIAGPGHADAQAAGAQTGASVPANAQGPGTSVAQTGSIVVSGAVVDPDGAEIPGATLTLTSAAGKAYVIQSGADGTYAFRGVPSGVYTLTVTMPGFASFVRQAVRVGEQVATVNAKLAVANQQTVVNVTTDENHVSVDQDSNASSTVLKGKDLDALSDDPDELSSELTALAGPSSGPNGGQIYIDGFTGGQLPPKSSIREIRINQNPFSAQYDQPGFGRVEVFTKPGTDKFRLYSQVNGNTKQFNTGSPFTDNAAQPDYHQIFGFGNLSGPLGKGASFTVGGSYRQIQNNSVVDPPAIYSTSQNAGTICGPGQQNTTPCAVYYGYSFAQFVPQTRWDISPRIDVALGEKNTLTARFQYEHNNLQNQGIGGNALPTTGYQDTSSETTLQLSDSQVFSDKLINETRFEYQRESSNTTPYSTAASVTVQGAFTGGGYGGGPTNDIQNHFEVQNYTSIALAKNFVRFGGRLRYTNETNSSTSGSTGSFFYSSICDYADIQSACTPTGTTAPAAPSLSDFSITEFNANNLNGTVKANVADLGLYAEDDWKIKPTWTFSYGVRFETQNDTHDKADFAPRFSTAYGIGKKTVVRAGFGLFYDRFNLENDLTTVRNNGLNQRSYTLSSVNGGTGTVANSCNPGNTLGADPTSPYGCAIGASRLTINDMSSSLRAPYRIQENVGIDQQLFSNATMSVNYQHIRGVHQFNSDVPDYAAPAGQNLLYEYQSEGEFNQNQLILNMNVRNFHKGTFGGFYALNFAQSDTSGFSSFASVPGNLRADYGRASFDVRSRLFVYGNFTLPHLVSVSPFIAYNSGSPYNILSGQDAFGDNLFNQRAVFVPGGTPAITNGYVKTIAGCGTFATPGTAANSTQVPINYCTGPAAFAFNVRVQKTWGFGAKTGAAAGQQAQGGGPGGGGPGGRGGGGGGRGGPGGGGPGGPGGASSGRRYNLSLGAQAQNLFNDANRSTPVGTLSSPEFGTSTSLAGFPFAAGSALRRFQLQASFSF